MTLINQIEAASGPSRELFYAAFKACGCEDEFHFDEFLSVYAWEQAALLLVPEGYFWSVTMRGENRGGYHACCVKEGPLEWHEGATAALAIVLAALKARGEQS